VEEVIVVGPFCGHRLAISTQPVRFFALFATAALVFSACGTATTSPSALASAAASESPAPAESASGQIGGSVTFIGAFTGGDQENFLAMVKPFEEKTGIKVNYTGTTSIQAVLTTGVASGVLPDLAGLPTPGQMAEYAKAGRLIDLSTIIDVPTFEADTAPALVELGKVDGVLYGAFMKAAVKGLLWYNTKVLDLATSPPSTWDALNATLAENAEKSDTPWCVGIESGGGTGWPATDWIEDLVLRRAGPEVYDQWWQGKVKWSDAPIKQAFQDFGDIVSKSYGGSNAVLTTNFANGGDALFADPPGCLLHHQASFITGFGAFKEHTPGTDFDFVAFPDMSPDVTGALEGAGDLVGMFHDTPQARALLQYLVTAEAQQVLVDIGGALAPNKGVTKYPDAISERSAGLLANAKSFVFDASDLMPVAMTTAFHTALKDYIKDLSSLDAVLADLDAAQADAYAQ